MMIQLWFEYVDVPIFTVHMFAQNILPTLTHDTCAFYQLFKLKRRINVASSISSIFCIFFWNLGYALNLKRIWIWPKFLKFELLIYRRFFSSLLSFVWLAHNGAPNAGYPQQQGGIYNQNPAGSYPIQQQPSYIPNGQQAPIVNNYYGSQQQPGGGGGSSLAKNALLLGGGAIAGATLYGALKPDEQSKTIIIHENASPVPSQPPNQANPAPGKSI